MNNIENSPPPSSADALLKEVHACFLTKKVPGKYEVGDMYARHKRELEGKIKKYLQTTSLAAILLLSACRSEQPEIAAFCDDGTTVLLDTKSSTLRTTAVFGKKGAFSSPKVPCVWHRGGDTVFVLTTKGKLLAKMWRDSAQRVTGHRGQINEGAFRALVE